MQYPVDPEHGALRSAIFGLTLTGGGFGCLLASIPAGGVTLLSVFGGLIGAALAGQAAERLLSQRWPSGKRVEIDTQGVRLYNKDQLIKIVDATSEVNVLLWKFEVPGRARVPRGWYVMACALEQNGTYLPVYAFMSPAQFQALKRAERFVTLLSKKDKPSDDLRLAGVQKRLRAAEDHRWAEGVEMKASEFETFVEQVESLFK